MNQVLSNTNSGAAADLLEETNEELRVDFFRKLGYSSAEVKAAFSKLGVSTDTNSVLGELVRTRTGTAACVSSADCDERSAEFKDSLLPHSWTPGPCRVAPQMGDQNRDTQLRPIVIDGSNVAMSHGNKEVFSCRGIQLAVNFFLERGHNAVTVFVPTWRKEQPRPDAPLTDQHILLELEKQKIVVFTPSRRVGGKRVVCYDDRFIVKLAYESEGVIVSNDTYRDLQGERPEWKKCIEERLLMYSFVNDKFMPPDDPLGRHGPNLDNFLRKNPLPVEQKKQLCPYDKKCTYGMKCKFYHPERSNQSYLSLADELREKAQISTAKEEKSANVSPRHAQSDPAPAASVFCCPPYSEIKRDAHVFACPSQVSENKLLYWEDLRNTPNRAPCSVTGTQCQKEWPGPHMTPNNYYANVSHEYLDSGLGSFESQYSDTSPALSNSHVLRPQHAGRSCGCGPASVPLTSRQHHAVNVDSEGQPNFDTYPSHVFPPTVANRHSLPGAFHYSGGPCVQQNYWSDPFQGPPVHSSHSHGSSSSYEGRQYSSWGQPRSPPPAFDSKRLELRKNLQAIFNPYQVDTVMEMFPHLTNAEKLAAEILNLKTQRGIF